MMKQKQKYFRSINQWLVFAFCLTPGGAAIANELAWSEKLSWEAFVSQTLIYTSDHNFLSQSDDRLSADMWEAGALFSAKLTPKLNFSAQLLARKISESSDEDIRLDYAFFSYPWYQSGRSTFGLRLGRIRSSYGLYNETRDMPHTRTGIVMPQSLYFDKTRNSFFSADGIELYAFHDFDENRLSYQLFLSRPFADLQEARETLLPVTGLKGEHSVLAKISFGRDVEGAKVSLTYYRPQYEFDISPALLQSDGKLYSESLVGSFEYNQYNWRLSAEYIYLKNKVLGVLPGASPLSPFFEKAGYADGWYSQFLWRFTEQWEAYTRFDYSKARHSSSSGYSSRSNYYSYDTTIGLSFRLDRHWLGRIEAHYVEGSFNLLTRDNTGPRNTYWNAVLMQLAYKW